MNLSHAASVDTFIEGRLPDWLTKASLDRLHSLHAALREQDNARHHLQQVMQHIPPLDQFALPLLHASLSHRGVRQIDARTCWVRIRQETVLPTVSVTLPPLHVVTHEKQLLLAAALHNYHVADTRSATGRKGQLVDERGKQLPIGFTAFAGMCRELDIGRRYQELLEQHLKPSDAPGEASGTAALRVRKLFENSVRARFEVDVRMAAMQGLVDEACYLHLLPVMSRRPVVPALTGTTIARQLYLLGKQIRGVATFEISTLPTSQVLMWIPGDPHGALTTFPSWEALYDELGKRLAEPAYQTFFFRFVSERDRAGFHQLLLQRVAGKPASGVPELDARHLPIDTPCFQHLATLHIAKLFDDARVLAVPTGDEDEQDRRQRLSFYTSVGMGLVGLAGLFLPVVGEVLLAVGALDIANEVYEGYQDWRRGDRQGALDHLFGVAENIVLGALIAKGGSVLLKTLDRYAFVDELAPVCLPSGQARLCASDLAAYRVQGPEAAGQAQELLRIDNADYFAVEDSASGITRLKHPLRKDAYAPEVFKNSAGGQFHELEYRQGWQGSGLLRRMQHSFTEMPEDVTEQLLRVTGFDQARIRQLHLESMGPPARIADVWELYQIGEQLPQLYGESLDEELIRRELPLKESGQLVRKSFPKLSARGIKEILDDLTDFQFDGLQKHQRVPLSVAQRARWYIREQRLDRACAGLQWARMANADTERLAIGLVEKLAPWSESIAVELRQGALDGLILARSGATEGAEVRTIIRHKQHYTFGSSDQSLELLEALKLTLEADQQLILQPEKALSLQALRERLVGAAADDREAAGEFIGLAVADKRLRPPLRFGDGRLGYSLSGGAGSSRRAIRCGIHRIFPTLNEEQLNAYLEGVIGRNVGLWEHYIDLDTNLNKLRGALRSWRGQADGPREVWRRHRVAQVLRKSWRRKITNDAGDYVLDINGQRVGRLPDLPPGLDFGHVRRMRLTDMALSELPQDFLARFPNLLSLDLRSNSLEVLPPGLERLTQLRQLLLSDNRLTISPADQARLDTLQRLQTLDLARNPLVQSPSLLAMRSLRRVNLRDTQLTELPMQIPPRAHLDLRENRIIQLRQDIRLLRDRLQRTALHDNPLDAASRRLVDEVAAGRGRGSAAYTHQEVNERVLSDWLGPQQGAQRERYTATWEALRAEQGASDLFRFLADFADGRDFARHREHYRRRIWSILEFCEQHEPLRVRLFQAAGGAATCDDRLLYILSELELTVQAERALGGVSGGQLEVELWSLGRAYYRLDEVDSVAARHIERMRAGGVEAGVDDIEVRMFYRTRLARSLGLPIESDEMHYPMFANVTTRDLIGVEGQVLSNETPQRLIDSLANRSFWQAHARDRYPERFDELAEPFQAQEEKNLADQEAGLINEWAYHEKAVALRHDYEMAEREWYRTLASELQQRLSVQA
ncbi:hypothetical protein IAE39_001570 [Pseudomonas sp. S37]|uniref:NEL-type E3 ubiquitin ligase domain-containing protein n=1 Tax=Pseudomonas sp. S37 TaxID=2767449 RepID=UPI0019147557|nr:NEL-type E3 ubiquitin ligase domain-containing protein [Pseudomonas sp. S37]MBK4993396.1 hypothetical protein [Pseudomonas sp. S37]